MPKLHELSDAYLLFVYGSVLNQIKEANTHKREIEEEIASRYKTIKEKIPKGQINIEKEDIDEEHSKQVG